MTKLEKLKAELKKCESEIEKLNAKKIELKDKIMLEEQSIILKKMKDKNLSFDEVMSLLD